MLGLIKGPACKLGDVAEVGDKVFIDFPGTSGPSDIFVVLHTTTSQHSDSAEV